MRHRWATIVVGCALAMAAGSCALHGPKAAPTSDAPSASATHALHNLHTVPGSDGRLISGSSPDDAAAFDELARLGVRTIISVDGGRPKIALARARGMRYVHIPVGYHTITREQQLALAKALRDRPGPVYIHCHHGKHRGPTAGALAAVSLGWITPETGEAFMREAGTAESYTGLWACVDRAQPLSQGALDAAPGELPEVAPVPDFTRAMVEMDEVFAHLQVIDAAGWTTPRDHPDLVPAAEAGRLADLYRACIEQGHHADRYDDFTRTMLRSLEVSQLLERAIVAKDKAETLHAMLGEIGASCKDCHVKHRDKRGW